MDSNQQKIVDFFEQEWPKLVEAAKGIWGASQPTGRYNGTITCPTDGQLLMEPYVELEQWKQDTALIKYCKICGKKVRVELSKEIMYEYEWRVKLLEMMLDDKVYKERMDELKGIKAEPKNESATEPKVL